MPYVIMFHVLTGNGGQWELSRVRGPLFSRESAEEKLREWGYSWQEGYQLGDTRGAWLMVCHHADDVPADQLQYCITKALVQEMEPV